MRAPNPETRLVAATPTGLAPDHRAPRGYAAALRLLLLWAPITGLASMQVPDVFTDSASSNGLKTLVFFGTLTCCLLLQTGATKLEARRIHVRNPSVDLDLLRIVLIVMAIADISVIATAFTGFEIAYDID